MFKAMAAQQKWRCAGRGSRKPAQVVLRRRQQSPKSCGSPFQCGRCNTLPIEVLLRLLAGRVQPTPHLLQPRVDASPIALKVHPVQLEVRLRVPYPGGQLLQNASCHAFSAGNSPGNGSAASRARPAIAPQAIPSAVSWSPQRRR